MDALTPAERQALKGRAHRLAPVVQLGNRGLSDAVIREIERALEAHELIKIRAPAMGRAERNAVLSDICARTGAQPVQHVGKILVVYRKAPTADIEATTRRGASATRNERPAARSASRRPASGRRPNHRRTAR